MSVEVALINDNDIFEIIKTEKLDAQTQTPFTFNDFLIYISSFLCQNLQKLKQYHQYKIY